MDAVTEPSVDQPAFTSTVGKLTAVNVLVSACAFVTSPILARGLGPGGRGELAAFAAIVGIAPWVTELGLTSFLTKEAADDRESTGTLLGSIIPTAVACSCLVAACAIPIAHLVGRGRPDVVRFIELGLYTLPLAVFSGTMSGIAVARGQWGAIIWTRLINTLGAAAAIVVLLVVGHLSVPTVASVYIVAGIVCNVPLLIVLRGSVPWRFRPSVVRRGLRFGLRAWLATVAQTGNLQLDQVLMAGLVSSRELGWYSLAATVATVSTAFTAAVSSALAPRAALGDRALAARASRICFFLVAVLGAVIAVTSPITIPLLFGDDFRRSIVMLVILLGAVAILAPGLVLGNALTFDGHPGATARAQLAALVVTVPGLILLLPPWGGVGAAIVTLVSYLVISGMVVNSACRAFGLGARELLVVNRGDLRWLRARLDALFHRARPRPA